MDDLRTGIIGFGYTGQLHLKAYAAIRGVKTVAAADTSPARLQAVPPGLARYSDYRRLLEQDIEAVSICSPTHLHCEIALAALARGKHVLIEKPIAVNMSEANRIVEAARQVGRALFVGMTHRFYPEVREAKQIIDDGAIGDIVFCNDSILEHFGFLDSPRWYLDKKLAGGGTVLTSGIHLVDRLRWFTGGEVIEVSGTASNPYFGGSVEDAAQMFLRFQSGVSAQVTLALLREPHPLVCDLQVIGTKGTLTVHTWRGYELHDCRGSRERAFYTNESHQQKVLVGMIAEVEEFCCGIREGRSPVPSAEESVKSMAVVEAFYRAAETGQPQVPESYREMTQ